MASPRWMTPPPTKSDPEPQPAPADGDPQLLSRGTEAGCFYPPVISRKVFRIKFQNDGPKSKGGHTHATALWGPEGCWLTLDFSQHFIHCVLMSGSLLCFHSGLGFLLVSFLSALVDTRFIWRGWGYFLRGKPGLSLSPSLSF